MKSTRKMAFIYALALIFSISFAIQFASASTPAPEVKLVNTLSEAELDRVLAPVALYPDTVLTHILIASTYPMDVIRAARWREKNEHVESDEILQRAEAFSWDPSVKALTPFNDILSQMSDDLDWLNYLGDSFIADEEWVLSRIQVLREQAYRRGTLHNNAYVKVVHEDQVIIIEPARPKRVYVPYYDTRIVYGPRWHVSTPYYWRHPRHYHYSSGFYWSPSIHIASHFFFGGFHWHHGYVVVDHGFHRHYRPGFHYGYKRVYSKSYKRWRHNVQHRRARYHDRVVHYPTRQGNQKTVLVHKRELNTTRYGAYQSAEPIRVSNHHQRLNNRKSAKVIRSTKEAGKVKQTTRLRQPIQRNEINKPTRYLRQDQTAKIPERSTKRQVSSSTRTVSKSNRSVSKSTRSFSTSNRSVSKSTRSSPKPSRSNKQISRTRRH